MLVYMRKSEYMESSTLLQKNWQTMSGYAPIQHTLRNELIKNATENNFANQNKNVCEDIQGLESLHCYQTCFGRSFIINFLTRVRGRAF